MVVGFVWSDAPESYTGSSVAAGRAYNARQFNQTTTIFNFQHFILTAILSYYSTMNFNKTYMIFKLWTDLDIL